MHEFLRHRGGSAAIEAAIFLPVFVLMTFGITDLGSQMFLRQQINAASQAGASYAVIHGCLSSGCSSQVYSAMNDAAGNSSFCTATAVCNFSPTTCGDSYGGICVQVTASYALTPILPSAVYSWAMSTTISSTVIVRVPVTS